MIRKLILQKQKFILLSMAVFCTICGFFVLLLAVQLYSDFTGLFTKNKSLIGNDYIVINKEVSVLNSIGLSANAFKDWEIQDLKSIDCVKDVGVFSSNSFSAQAYREEGKNMPKLRSEMFFEAIPDKFIDINPENWHWEVGDTLLPIIVSSEYLNLYNYGFAPSQGMPQISEGTIKTMVNFKIKIEGKGKEKTMLARIAGFSDRINSILVPQSFLNYGNENFGNRKLEPSRLILECKDPSAPELAKYISDNGYKTNADKLKNSKLNAILRAVMETLGVLGLIIIVVSMLGFVLYGQLMVQQSAYEIALLAAIGYKPSTIIGSYTKFYVVVFMVTGVVSLLILWLSKLWLVGWLFNSTGVELPSGISAITIILEAIVLFLFIGINTLGYRRSILLISR